MKYKNVNLGLFAVAIASSSIFVWIWQSSRDTLSPFVLAEMPFHIRIWWYLAPCLVATSIAIEFLLIKKKKRTNYPSKTDIMNLDIKITPFYIIVPFSIVLLFYSIYINEIIPSAVQNKITLLENQCARDFALHNPFKKMLKSNTQTVGHYMKGLFVDSHGKIDLSLSQSVLGRNHIASDITNIDFVLYYKTESVVVGQYYNGAGNASRNAYRVDLTVIFVDWGTKKIIASKLFVGKKPDSTLMGHKDTSGKWKWWGSGYGAISVSDITNWTKQIIGTNRRVKS